MRLAIVGGGMAGLAAAYAAERLAGPELEVALFEASERLGGKVRTLREGGFVIEGGADALVRYKPWALELAEELGLGGEIVETLPAESAASIVVRDRAYPLPAGLNVALPGRLGPLARTPLLSAGGKLRALGDLVLPRGSGGDEPFGAFVSRRFGRELWERLAAPLVGGIYGGDPFALSTEAAFPQLLVLERRHRSLILGARRLAREQARNPEAGSLFASLTDGLERLAEAVAASLARTRVRLETPVRRLEELGADAVVLAVPAYAAAEILGEAAPEAAASLREIPYADALGVTLAFPADGFPATRGHGVLFAAGEGGQVRGFTWVDRKWPNRVPPGRRLVRAFLDADGSDEELVGIAVGGLERLLGRVPAPLRSWIFRWPRAMPQYKVGHLRHLRAAEEALAVLPGVFLAGAAYRGVGVPDVIRDGREAAAAAVRTLQQQPL